jgi:hypothetical protein
MTLKKELEYREKVRCMKIYLDDEFQHYEPRIKKIYHNRFPNKFKCELCKKVFDLKRQRECKYCSQVVCEFCLDEYGICEDCNSEEDKGNDVC